MVLSASSQNTSNVESNSDSVESDTITLKLHRDDAKLILNDLLNYEITDSLLESYIEKDSINMQIINEKNIIITSLEEDVKDLKIITNKQTEIILNKDLEIEILNKEVKKQKRHKIFAIVGACFTPILTLLIMSVS